MLRFFFGIFLFPLLVFAQPQQQWVDSVFNAMTLDQKIGQLFMIMTYPDGNVAEQNFTKKQIAAYHVGGILFSKGTSSQQQKDTQRYQKFSQLPLLIAADAEWGMAMRLSDVSPYPYAMTLGALPNDELIYAVAKRLGDQKRAMGIHISFAPVVDVNTEAKNPIIGVRSFGDNPKRVARHARAFAEGLQDAGILAVAKHFPGHGSVVDDSHKSLPVLQHDVDALDSIDLVPFKSVFSSGIKGVMVGHLSVPALDNNSGVPVSVSTKVVTNLLQEQMGFNGLVFTDALNMKGITQKVPSPALETFLAGADVLLIPENLAKAIKTIKNAYVSGTISPKRLAFSVKKILKAKADLGLHTTNRNNNVDALATNYVDNYLKQHIAEQSIVSVHTDASKFPLTSHDDVFYAHIGNPVNTVFYNFLQTHGKIKQFSFDNNKKSIHRETIIVGVFADTSTPWSKQSISKKDIIKLHDLAMHNDVHVILYANPYTLMQLPNNSVFSSVLLAHENQPEFVRAAVKILFGKSEAVGILPINTSRY